MDIELQVLVHLLSRPAHGYDLKARIAESVGDTQLLHSNLIYPALHRMADRGDIAEVPEPGSRRKVYRITEQGSAQLVATLSEAQESLAEDDADFFTCVAIFDAVPPGAARHVLRLRREVLERREAHNRQLSKRSEIPAWSRRVLYHQRRQLLLDLAWLTELEDHVPGAEEAP